MTKKSIKIMRGYQYRELIVKMRDEKKATFTDIADKIMELHGDLINESQVRVVYLRIKEEKS